MTTPFDNTQPSLVLTQTIALFGEYPLSGSSPNSATLGTVHTYAFNYAPESEPATNGQLLNISQNTALFSVLGTTYGGNGTTNFALPNLQGQLSVGSGQGLGLTNVGVGQQTGTASYTITLNNLPGSDGGGNLPIPNVQPEVGTQYAICAQGIFPQRDGSGGSTDYVGAIVQFAGARSIDPSDGGYVPCDGRTLNVRDYPALYAIIGNIYGGDGVNTFDVPDLRGRDIVGVSSTHQLGTTFGQEQIALNHSQLPNANASPQSVLNEQPGLALNYVIAVNGIYPSRSGVFHDSEGAPVMGEVSAFAGNFAPAGYLLCQGQLLSINQNQALFSLLGTTYGGDGISTFALPDLSGRSVMGAGTTNYGTFQVGQKLGSETHVLTAAEVPNFIHPANTVPGGQTSDVAGHLVFSSGNADAISVKDADSSVLTTTLDVSHGTLSLSQTTGLSVSGQGTAHVQLTGSASSINAALNGLSYQSTTGYSGGDAVTVATTDGQFIDTDTITLIVPAAPVNHAPNTATHFAGVAEGSAIPVTALGDTDPDGDTVATTAGAIIGTYGTLTLTADDKFSYAASNLTAINSAAKGSHPVDIFTYTASDGHGGTTTETLNITLNRAPLANRDAVTVQIAAGRVTATGNVLANDDTDADGDGIAVTSVAVGTGTATSVSSGTAGTTVHGTYGDLTLHADGSYTYTNGVTSLQQSAIHGAQGTQPVDTFSYTVSDWHGGTSSTALTVNLTLPTFHLQTTDVTYIQNAPAVPLIATSTDPGATFNWYIGPVGGTAFTSITPSTASSDTYYVSETYAGVESARQAVNVIVMADATPPTLTSTAVVAPATGAASNASATTFTVHFSEYVMGVDLADFTLAHTGTAAGAIAAVTDSGNHQDYTIAVSGITGTGTLAVALASSPTVTDRAGNPLAATGLTASTAHTVDRDAPRVVSILSDATGPTNATTLTERVTFSEAVTGLDKIDFIVTSTTGAAATVTTLTPVGTDGTTYDVGLTGVSGDGTLRLDFANATQVQDAAGNTAGTYAGGAVTVLDHTAPTVTSITTATASPSNTTTLTEQVVFSEAVTGVDAADFTVRGASGQVVSGATVSTPISTDGGKSYSVTISGLTGDGAVHLDLNPTGTGIADTAGNATSGGFTGASTVLDHTAPTVTSITTATASPSNATTLTEQVVFSEAVTGVDAADFTVRDASGQVVSGATIGTPISTDGGKSYSVTVSGLTGDGAVHLDLNPTGTGIADSAGNATSGGFTGAVTVLDHTAPTITSITTTIASPSNATTLTEQVVFSEIVTGVDAADFTVRDASGQAVPGATIGTPISTDGGKSYSITVSGLTGDGAVHLDLNPTGTGIVDAAGNQNSGGFTGAVTVLDHTAPVVTSITTATVSPSNATALTMRVTFSEAVTSLDKTDFTVTSTTGAAATVTTLTPVGTDGTTYDVGLTGVSGDGTVRLDFANATQVQDAAGNLASAYTGGAVTVLDHTPPTITLLRAYDGGNNTLPTDASGSSVVNAAALAGGLFFSAVTQGVENGGGSSPVSTGTFTLVGVSGPAAGVTVIDHVSEPDTAFSSPDQAGDGVFTLALKAGSASLSAFRANVPDGVYILKADVVDKAGNPAPEVIRTILIDRTADAGAKATLTVDDTTDHLINAAEAKAVGFTVAGLDADATAVATFTDGTHTATASVTQNGVGTVDLSGLSGAVTSSLAITDAHANTASAAGNTVTLDTKVPAAPSQPADASVVNGYVGASHDPTVQGPGGGGQILTGTAEGGSTVTVYDGASRLGTTIADPVSGAWSYTIGTLADASSHAYTVTATDGAGNTGPASAVLAFLVDTTAPGIPGVALTHDTGASGTDSVTSDASLMVTPAETGGSLSYSVDNGAATSSYAPTTLADGSHTVTVIQTDAAGNASAAGSVSFVLDTTAPTVAISGVSGSANHATGHTITGTLGAADAGATVTVYDGKTVLGTAISDGTGHFSLSFADTKDGATHSFALTASATDLAGNVGVSAEQSFAFDYTSNRADFGTVAYDTTSHAGQVYALYEGLLDRAPDAAGAQSWMYQLDHGVSLAAVTQSFLASTEGQAHFAPGSSNAAYVEQLYGTVLHRQGDPAGAQGWATLLDQGATRADVADQFVFSAEHWAELQPALSAGVYLADPTAIAVARLYYGLLDRAPDAGGLQAYSSSVHDGTSSLGAVAQSFLSSAEYVTGHGAQTDQQYVDGLYMAGLGRSAEAAGEQNWLVLLAHGTSRADVALGILESPEAQQHLAGHIDNGWHLA